jgi:hypothetical protein
MASTRKHAAARPAGAPTCARFIAIFDDDDGLTQAMASLHELQLGDGAMSVLGGARHDDVQLPGAGPAVLSGLAPQSRNAGVSVHDDQANGPVKAAVQQEFGDLLDSDEQLRYYASVLAHDRRLLALRVAQAEADSVMAVLNTCTANHIDHIEHN